MTNTSAEKRPEGRFDYPSNGPERPPASFPRAELPRGEVTRRLKAQSLNPTVTVLGIDADDFSGNVDQFKNVLPTLNDRQLELGFLHLQDVLRQSVFGTVVRYARLIGQFLIELKPRIAKRGKGEWERWLDDKFDGSRRTAQKWMKLARDWDTLVAKGKVRPGASLNECLGYLTDEKPKLEVDDDDDESSVPPETEDAPSPDRIKFSVGMTSKQFEEANSLLNSVVSLTGGGEADSLIAALKHYVETHHA